MGTSQVFYGTSLWQVGVASGKSRDGGGKCTVARASVTFQILTGQHATSCWTNILGHNRDIEQNNCAR